MKKNNIKPYDFFKNNEDREQIATTKKPKEERQ